MLNKIKRFLKELGPGIVAGASGDDPSGIATYSQTGAKYGLGMLWTAIFTLPLLYVVQEIAGRIGVVTGEGIAKNIKQHYPKIFLYFIVSLLVIANVINLGADLGAIVSGIQLLVPIHFDILLICVTIIIICLEVFTSYKQYSKILKWLTFSLFAYIITGFLIKKDLGELLHATFVPNIQLNFEFMFLIVGNLGTTISPFMLFWQANQEVEEEMEKRILPRKGGIPKFSLNFLKSMRVDTLAGMIFSQVTTWFIIVTTALTLHKGGIFNIETAAQAAQALEPLVQNFPNAGLIAKCLFALGIIGTGLLAIPIFAGSASYAISEVFDFSEGLNKKFKRAKFFYLVIVIATVAGMVLNFIGINPIQALVWCSVLNAIVSAPLIGMILLISNNKKIMGEYTNKPVTNIIGTITFIIMLLGIVGIIASLF